MCLTHEQTFVRVRDSEELPEAKRPRVAMQTQGPVCIAKHPKHDPGQYAAQQQTWEDAVVAAGGPQGVKPILPCFRNHHAMDEKTKQVLSKVAFGKKIADNFNFVPDGLLWRDSFLSPEEERWVLAQLDAEGGSLWECAIQRRVQQFGFTFDHSSGGVLKHCDRQMPEWSKFIIDRLVEQGLAPERFNQLIVNEYSTGQGIAPHFDRPCFGERIAVVSLLFPVTMCWSNEKDRRAADFGVPVGECVLTHLTRGSVAVFGGSGRSQVGEPGKGSRAAARWQWQHAIAKSPLDVDHEGRIIRRQRRISLTFRTVDAANARKAELLSNPSLKDKSPMQRQRRASHDESSESSSRQWVPRWEKSGWKPCHDTNGPVVVQGGRFVRQEQEYDEMTNHIVWGERVSVQKHPHVFEFTMDTRWANACFGVASDSCAASSDPEPGKVFGAVMPHGWGVACWADGSVHGLDRSGMHPHYLEESGGVRVGSDRRSLTVRMVVSWQGVDVMVEGSRGWRRVNRFWLPDLYEGVTPFAFLALNEGERVSVGLKHSQQR
eukprot:Hpha_TRINITY_DN15927_c7_g3::TRINITY_DN15927_c7_g3_i1::g.74261::m.74261/K10770/ALKBH8; alkylated DNA repair protein alkB homolog 8